MIYLPLILAGLFSALFALIQAEAFGEWMPYFMGYFLCFFAYFKLIDVKGFAKSFAEYDLVTQKYPQYGMAYPFIELFLGIFFLTNFIPLLTNLALLGVMSVSSVGILKKVLSGESLKCACMGTALNVPLGYVSVVESVGMALMAALNLYLMA